MNTLVAGVVLIILIGLGWYFYSAVKGTTDGPVACTADAKLCPDGSYVGRVGPHCEFAPCP